MSDQPNSFGGDPSNNANQTSFQDQGGESGGGNVPSQEELQKIMNRDKHAQEHIRKLEQEAKDRGTQLETLSSQLKELQEKLNKQDTLDEALRKLEEQRQRDGNSGDQTIVDPDQIAAQVQERLQEQTRAQTAEQNKAQAIEAAKQRYGEDKFLDSIKEAAGNLGMSLEDVDNMAARSPEAFKRLFIGEDKGNTKRDTGVRGQNTRFAEQHGNNSAATQRELYQSSKKDFWSTENMKRIAEQRN